MNELIVSLMILLGISCIGVSFFFERRQQKTSVRQEEIDEQQLTVQEVKQKIIELHQYGDFLKTELDKKQKEIMFVYQMILDKKKELDTASNSKIKEEVRQESSVIQPIDNQSVVANQPLDTQFQTSVDINQQILVLHDQGYSNEEIARRLAIGLGRIDLVLHLYS